MEESGIAVVGIIVKDKEAYAAVNALLHEYAHCVIGRLGVPYKDKGISVISVILDAPAGIVNSLTGKLGMTGGVTAKALFGKL